MINTISIALSGLEAASKRLQASASNIANLQTVGSISGGADAPYTPQTVVQNAQTDEDGNVQGVQSEIQGRQNPFVPAFDPDSPFADENGIIGVPNINLAEEAVNSRLAEITFKANIATIKTAEELSDELFRIFDEDA